jgi:hypothetical protein
MQATLDLGHLTATRTFHELPNVADSDDLAEPFEVTSDVFVEPGELDALAHEVREFIDSLPQTG